MDKPQSSLKSQVLEPQLSSHAPDCLPYYSFLSPPSPCIAMINSALELLVDEDAVGTGMPSCGDESGAQTAVVLGTKRVETPADDIAEILGWLGRCGLHDDGGCGQDWGVRVLRIRRCRCLGTAAEYFVRRLVLVQRAWKIATPNTGICRGGAPRTGTDRARVQ